MHSNFKTGEFKGNDITLDISEPLTIGRDSKQVNLI
jgi:hypothetical protein